MPASPIARPQRAGGGPFRAVAGTVLALVLLLAAVAAEAATRAEADRLLDRIGLPELIDILRAEGLRYGDSLGRDVLGAAAGPTWTRHVARAYDPERMDRVFRDAFATAVAADDLGPALDFFDSDLGRRLVASEVATRRLLLDEAAEDQAARDLANMRADGDPRLAQVDAFVAANDLIDANVTGTLNARLAFLSGLRAGRAAADRRPFGALVDQVRRQEPAVREEIDVWMTAYVALAFRPFPAADLDAYVALSRTPSGQAMNRGLFAAFDVLYDGISRDLGRTAAGLMGGRDI